MMMPSTKSVSGNLCGQEKETEEQVRGDDRANEVGCAEGAVEAMQLPESDTKVGRCVCVGVVEPA